MTSPIRIPGYNFTDIKDGILHQLHIAAGSMEVRQHALDITADKQDKISAVFDWVKQHVRYVPDPVDIELIVSPRKLIEDYNKGHSIAEDCDGHAILLTALYRSIGMRSHVYVVDCIGQGFDHALSVVWSDRFREWIHVDTTTEYPLGWIIRYNKGVFV